MPDSIQKYLEALDHLEQAFGNNQNQFGGVLILITGEWMNSLILWEYVKTTKLHMNRRVELPNDRSGEVFSKQFLDIDDVKIPVDKSSEYITFPANFYHLTNSKMEFIKMVLYRLQKTLM